MEDYTIDYEKNMLPWLGRTSKLIDYYIADFLSNKGIDLTKVQMLLLKRLKESNGQPQHNLAFLTNRDKASLARLLNTMEKKTLVARIPSEKDHRINLIYITKNGEALLKEAWPYFNIVVDQIHQGIKDTEITALISVLKRIQHNLGAEDLAKITFQHKENHL